jgi:monoamine oxidase
MSSQGIHDPIIVVGAGLAGLTAAHTLAKAGVATVVFEAHREVGGRVRTHTAGFGAELGAEFVHPGSSAVTALCRELGVQLSNREPQDGTARSACATALQALLVPGGVIVDGTRIPAAVLKSIVAEFDDARLRTPPVPPETVAQWVRRARLSAAAGAVLGAAGRALTQLDPARADACALTASFAGSPQRVMGGTHRLSEALADGLDVRLNSPVVAVRQRRGTITVTLDSGDTLTSSQAVIAVAPAVLGTIGFDPPLPAATTVAATSGPRAQGGKVVARYRGGADIRQALGGGVVTDGIVNRAWIGDPEATEDSTIVNGLICGTDRAVLERSDLALEALDRVVYTATGCTPARTGGVVQNWSADPHVLGAGGVPPAPLRGEQVAILAAPERRVHFAGAHTDDEFCDTLEGAVRSGLRAAADVLRHPVRVSAHECNTRLVRA